MLMQETLGGESVASAKKALAKVQKMLQIATVKRNALARKDYHETLEVRCIALHERRSAHKLLFPAGVLENGSQYAHEDIGLSPGV